MTVSAVAARTDRAKRRTPPRADRLVPFTEAATTLSKQPETLKLWHDLGHLPAVKSPGGQWSTFKSFIDAVLASARPGHAGDIQEIARVWFAEHGTATEAIA
jgi:hypothetical protein